MEIELILLKDWTHDGTEYKAGEKIGVSEELAAKLLVNDTARKWSADDEKREVKAKEDAELQRVRKIAQTVIEEAAQKGVVGTRIDVKEPDNFGYKNWGEFVLDARAAQFGGTPSDRFAFSQKAATAPVNTGTDAEGGFLLPENMAMSIWQRPRMQESLFARTDQYTITAGNSMTFPKDAESSRANGSRRGGVRGYWTAESGTTTQSAPTWKCDRLELHKIVVVAGVTEEMRSDAPLLGDYITRVMAEELAFKVDDAIINGTGAGQPQGILNSTGKVEVSAETGQASTTIVSENIIKMHARRFAEYKDYIWLHNQDIEPQLHTLTLAVGTGGGAATPLFMPPGGITGRPFGTLYGLPLVPSEFAATLGTAGDLILWSPSSYRTLKKGTPTTAVSAHIWFLSGEDAVRTVWRIDGANSWDTTLTPYKGSGNTQAPVITLASR